MHSSERGLARGHPCVDRTSPDCRRDLKLKQPGLGRETRFERFFFEEKRK